MFYEYSPTYNKIKIGNGFKENTPYFLACIKNNTVEVIEITIAEMYTEDHIVTNTKKYYVKLNIPQEYYPSFLHKWFDKKETRLEFKDKKILLDYIKDTKEEALISFFNIMKNRHTELADLIDPALNDFIDRYPDIYLSRMQNYVGVRQSHPPKLYHTKEYGIETTSW